MKSKAHDIKEGSTPVMRQYHAVKAQYPDALVLFRMGDFYETFQQDAKTAAKILNITLTKRANGKAASVPLAGFPYHALEAYLHKLLKAGLKVAICEQVEDPKTARGVVKREVVEVITPGTTVTDRFLEGKNNNYLLSVVWDEKLAGLAAIDVSTGEFYLTEIALPRVEDYIRSLHPAEIICPEAILDEIQSQFAQQVLRITALDDWVYVFDFAYQTLTDHFKTASLKGYGVQQARLGIAAAGAIIHYLRSNYQTELTHISALRYQSDVEFLMKDEFTQRNLEIFRTLQSGEKRGSLIDVLDRTVTAAGSRLLKNWIIRPLRQIPQINDRLDQITHLVEQPVARRQLCQLLAETCDLERILSRLSTNRASARELLALKSTLSSVPEIKDILSPYSAFALLLEQMDPLEDLVELLDKSLMTENLPLSVREGGFIRDGYSKELDELRDLIFNGKAWIARLQQSEREKLEIPSLRVGYNKVFGYYIEVTKTHSAKIPADYIRKQTLVNSERYITEDLKNYEEKLLTAEEQLTTLEYDLFQVISRKVLQKTALIQRNARILAQLDVIASLAELAEKQNYTRPEVNGSSVIIIRDGRHPVVEYLLPPGEKFVPNDLNIDNEHNQILIITGPNMAGKSTYLRQVGLIVLMAQIGSYVPAASAQIGVVDKVFTRVGASDNLAFGESTFLMEMNETANILNNVTPHSLVLLDEIGRGTSTYDGMSIAWAVTEYLHQHQEVASKTLFATHYHELTKMEEILPRVKNFNVAVREYADEVIFLRKIVPGGCDKSYGIHVAQMAGIPVEVILRAKEIMSNLSQEERVLPVHEDKYLSQSRNVNQLNLFDKRERELIEQLKMLDINNITPLEAMRLLDELRQKYGT
jgi:DNA mismatch repair protein MutS